MRAVSCDHGILLPACLTQEVLAGCPSKTKSLLLWKTLAGTTQMVDFPAGITSGLYGAFTEAQWVSPQRPREGDKGVSVGKVLGKYKVAPTSCRQHLVPSLA